MAFKLNFKNTFILIIVDIYRMVLVLLHQGKGYLNEGGWIRSYDVFLNECVYLAEYRSLVESGETYPTTIGNKSLCQMLEEYGQIITNEIFSHDESNSSFTKPNMSRLGGLNSSVRTAASDGYRTPQYNFVGNSDGVCTPRRIGDFQSPARAGSLQELTFQRRPCQSPGRIPLPKENKSTPRCFKKGPGGRIKDSQGTFSKDCQRNPHSAQSDSGELLSPESDPSPGPPTASRKYNTTWHRTQHQKRLRRGGKRAARSKVLGDGQEYSHDETEDSGTEMFSPISNVSTSSSKDLVAKQTSSSEVKNLVCSTRKGTGLSPRRSDHTPNRSVHTNLALQSPSTTTHTSFDGITISVTSLNPYEAGKVLGITQSPCTRPSNCSNKSQPIDNNITSLKSQSAISSHSQQKYNAEDFPKTASIVQNEIVMGQFEFGHQSQSTEPATPSNGEAENLTCSQGHQTGIACTPVKGQSLCTKTLSGTPKRKGYSQVRHRLTTNNTADLDAFAFNHGLLDTDSKFNLINKKEFGHTLENTIFEFAERMAENINSKLVSQGSSETPLTAPPLYISPQSKPSTSVEKPNMSPKIPTPGNISTPVTEYSFLATNDLLSTASAILQGNTPGQPAMTQQDIDGIVEMTRTDPVFDALFSIFNVDKHEFIEREYGVQSKNDWPAMSSSEAASVLKASTTQSQGEENSQTQQSGNSLQRVLNIAEEIKDDAIDGEKPSEIVHPSKPTKEGAFSSVTSAISSVNSDMPSFKTNVTETKRTVTSRKTVRAPVKKLYVSPLHSGSDLNDGKSTVVQCLHQAPDGSTSIEYVRMLGAPVPLSDSDQSVFRHLINGSPMKNTSDSSKHTHANGMHKESELSSINLAGNATTSKDSTLPDLTSREVVASNIHTNEITREEQLKVATPDPSHTMHGSFMSPPSVASSDALSDNASTEFPSPLREKIKQHKSPSPHNSGQIDKTSTVDTTVRSRTYTEVKEKGCVQGVLSTDEHLNMDTYVSDSTPEYVIEEKYDGKQSPLKRLRGEKKTFKESKSKSRSRSGGREKLVVKLDIFTGKKSKERRKETSNYQADKCLPIKKCSRSTKAEGIDGIAAIDCSEEQTPPRSKKSQKSSKKKVSAIKNDNIQEVNSSTEMCESAASAENSDQKDKGQCKLHMKELPTKLEQSNTKRKTRKDLDTPFGTKKRPSKAKEEANVLKTTQETEVLDQVSGSFRPIAPAPKPSIVSVPCVVEAVPGTRFSSDTVTVSESSSDTTHLPKPAIASGSVKPSNSQLSQQTAVQVGTERATSGTTPNPLLYTFVQNGIKKTVLLMPVANNSNPSVGANKTSVTNTLQSQPPTLDLLSAGHSAVPVQLVSTPQVDTSTQKATNPVKHVRSLFHSPPNPSRTNVLKENMTSTPVNGEKKVKRGRGKYQITPGINSMGSMIATQNATPPLILKSTNDTSSYATVTASTSQKNFEGTPLSIVDVHNTHDFTASSANQHFSIFESATSTQNQVYSVFSQPSTSYTISQTTFSNVQNVSSASYSATTTTNSYDSPSKRYISMPTDFLALLEASPLPKTPGKNIIFVTPVKMSPEIRQKYPNMSTENTEATPGACVELDRSNTESSQPVPYKSATDETRVSVWSAMRTLCPDEQGQTDFKMDIAETMLSLQYQPVITPHKMDAMLEKAFPTPAKVVYDMDTKQQSVIARSLRKSTVEESPNTSRAKGNGKCKKASKGKILPESMGGGKVRKARPLSPTDRKLRSGHGKNIENLRTVYNETDIAKQNENSTGSASSAEAVVPEINEVVSKLGQSVSVAQVSNEVTSIPEISIPTPQEDVGNEHVAKAATQVSVIEANDPLAKESVQVKDSTHQSDVSVASVNVTAPPATFNNVASMSVVSEQILLTPDNTDSVAALTNTSDTKLQVAVTSKNSTAVPIDSDASASKMDICEKLDTQPGPSTHSEQPSKQIEGKIDQKLSEDLNLESGEKEKNRKEPLVNKAGTKKDNGEAKKGLGSNKPGESNRKSSSLSLSESIDFALSQSDSTQKVKKSNQKIVSSKNKKPDQTKQAPLQQSESESKKVVSSKNKKHYETKQTSLQQSESESKKVVSSKNKKHYETKQTSLQQSESESTKVVSSKQKKSDKTKQQSFQPSESESKKAVSLKKKKPEQTKHTSSQQSESESTFSPNILAPKEKSISPNENLIPSKSMRDVLLTQVHPINTNNLSPNSEKRTWSKDSPQHTSLSSTPLRQRHSSPGNRSTLRNNPETRSPFGSALESLLFFGQQAYKESNKATERQPRLKFRDKHSDRHYHGYQKVDTTVNEGRSTVPDLCARKTVTVRRIQSPDSLKYTEKISRLKRPVIVQSNEPSTVKRPLKHKLDDSTSSGVQNKRRKMQTV